MSLIALTPALATLALTLDPAPCPRLEQVPFDALAEKPELWLGERVETIVQFAGTVDEPWFGFLSGFDPETHTAFEFWSDDQELWVAEQHAAPAGRLFTSAVGPDLSDVARYSRLRLTVHVTAFTAGRGWIEIEEATPTRESVGEGTILHAIRGLELLEQGSRDLAASELERALLAPLPEHHEATLKRALAKARTAPGESL